MANYTQTTEQVVRNIFVSFLPSWWKKGYTNEQVLSGLSVQLSEFTTNLEGLDTEKSVNGATGSNLDDFGKLFKLARFSGESNSSYRARIKAYFQAFSGGGTAEGIENALSLMTGLSSDTITVTDVEGFHEQLFMFNMEATETWTGTGVSSDTTYFYEGTQGKRITATGAETKTASSTRAFDLDFNIEDNDYVRIWCYVDDVTKVTSVGIDFTDGSANTASASVLQANLTDDGQFLLVPKSDFTLTGAFDWGDVASTDLSLVSSAATFVTFDWMQFGTYDSKLMFDVEVGIDSSVDTSVFDVIEDTVEIAKAAGVYNRRLTLQSSGGEFLINLSYINGGDII